MRCPRCNHESESEDFGVPAQCPACGVFLHKLTQKPVSARKEEGPDSAVRRSMTKVILGGVFAVFLLIGGTFLAVAHYERGQLVAKAGANMRAANGYVGELLDETAGLTNAGYLAKVHGRIQRLDELVADSMAIDDRRLPGLSDATADYVRASRAFVNAFTEHVSANIATQLASGELEAHQQFARSSDGAMILGSSAEEISRRSQELRDKVDAGGSLSEKVDALGEAAQYGKLMGLRIEYMKAVAKQSAASERYAEASRRLGGAGAAIQKAGDAVTRITGEPMPTKAWMLKAE